MNWNYHSKFYRFFAGFLQILLVSSCALPGRSQASGDNRSGVDSSPLISRQPLLKAGLSQVASDELRALGIVSSQVMQTIGNAPASAGVHAQDGVDPFGNPYCAATDISVKHPVRLSSGQIKKLLEDLADHGFAAFYRDPGHDHWPSTEAEHIHAIYVGISMKPALQGQVVDWLHGKNGLKSHAPYQFWQPDAAEEEGVGRLYQDHTRE